ncbi:MAG TPA: hypothetical protein VGD98_08770 [Ktedonobacteraceae bacterium]
MLSDAHRNRTNAFLPNQSNLGFVPENVPGPNQSAIRRQGPQQASSLHQDATEAISFVPGTAANYPPATYSQQGFNQSSVAGRYPGSSQFGSQIQPQQQPLLSGNYPHSTFPPTQMSFPNGQFAQGSYGSGVGRAKQEVRHVNVAIVVGIVCLVFAIITVGVFGILFGLRNNNNPSQTAPVALATATPSPLPSPTTLPTPSPTPTIAVTPTPTPDANFNWCDTQCAQKGFQIEVYQGWGTQPVSDQGLQFTSPDHIAYAAVKLPAGGADMTTVFNNDLQEIANLNNATPTAPLSACQSGPQQISTSTWTCETTNLQINTQNPSIIQAIIYATFYQNQAYVIELVAPQDSFATAQNTYFTPMLKSFQFIAPTQ